jgi:hypothetical protein
MQALLLWRSNKNYIMLVCVCSLVTQHIVICGLSGATEFFHILIQSIISERELLNRKFAFDFL